MNNILEKLVIPMSALSILINVYIWILEKKHTKEYAYLYTLLILASFFIMLRDIKNVK